MRLIYIKFIIETDLSNNIKHFPTCFTSRTKILKSVIIIKKHEG